MGRLEVTWLPSNDFDEVARVLTDEHLDDAIDAAMKVVHAFNTDTDHTSKRLWPSMDAVLSYLKALTTEWPKRKSLRVSEESRIACMALRDYVAHTKCIWPQDVIDSHRAALCFKDPKYSWNLPWRPYVWAQAEFRTDDATASRHVRGGRA